MTGMATSGAVLAGGQSRRLGLDKTTLPWPPDPRATAAGAAVMGEPEAAADSLPPGPAAAASNRGTLLEHTAETLAGLCDEVLVVAFRGRRPLPLAYRAVPDLYPDGGSLGGIYSALAAARHDTVLAVATDMPFLNLPLLRWMLEQPRDFDVLVPVREQPEPLHALYGKGCLEPMRQHLEAGRLKITGFFPEVRVREVPPEVLRRYDPEGLSFFNVNTPEDLQRAHALLARTTPGSPGRQPGSSRQGGVALPR